MATELVPLRATPVLAERMQNGWDPALAANWGMIVLDDGVEVRAHRVNVLKHDGEPAYVYFWLPCDHGMHEMYQVAEVRLMTGDGVCVLTAVFPGGIWASPLHPVFAPLSTEELP